MKKQLHVLVANDYALTALVSVFVVAVAALGHVLLSDTLRIAVAVIVTLLACALLLGSRARDPERAVVTLAGALRGVRGLRKEVGKLRRVSRHNAREGLAQAIAAQKQVEQPAKQAAKESSRSGASRAESEDALRAKEILASIKSVVAGLAEVRMMASATQRSLEAGMSAQRELTERVVDGLQPLEPTQDLPDFKAVESDTEEQFKRRIVRELRLGRVEQLQEFAATLQLSQRHRMRSVVPPLGGWAVKPSVLAELLDIISRRTPELIVECGSGSSSIWFGYGLEATGSGRLVSLEHDATYASHTQSTVDKHGLSDLVSIRHASLSPCIVNGDEGQWYDPNAWSDLYGIDLLFVDGPPQSAGLRARMPAFPLLRERMNDGCIVVLDDTDRQDEKDILDAWLAIDEELRMISTVGGRSTILQYR